MLLCDAFWADSLLAGLAEGVDLLKGMFLALGGPLDLHFPLQGIVERNQLVRGCPLHLAMNRDARITEILPAIDAMHRGCFLVIASLALHLVGILHCARDRFREGINEHSTPK